MLSKHLLEYCETGDADRIGNTVSDILSMRDRIAETSKEEKDQFRNSAIKNIELRAPSFNRRILKGATAENIHMIIQIFAP